MGLLMASSIPQLRTAALNAIRNLVLEEETLCIRCGGQTEVLKDALFGGKGNLSAITGSQPWMDCLVHCLEMDVVEGNGRGGGGNGGDGGGDASGSESNDGIPTILL
jgi:hypothetical protein